MPEALFISETEQEMNLFRFQVHINNIYLNRYSEASVLVCGLNVIIEHILVLVNHFYLHWYQNKRNILGLDKHQMIIVVKIKQNVKCFYLLIMKNWSLAEGKIKRKNFSIVLIDFLLLRNGDGLCIDQSLCEGRTAHCETFNNEPLCSQPYFSISVLEMIAFDFSSS